MKNIDWNKKYTTISIYAFLVVCASILFYNALNNIPSIKENLNMITTTLQPFTIGFVIAYLLNFVLSFLEERVLSINPLNKLKKKSKRTISITLTYLISFVTLYLFGKFVIPQVIDSITLLINDIPTYVANFSKTVEEASKVINLDEKQIGFLLEKGQEVINYALTILSSLMPLIGGFLTTAISSIWNLILGLIISIYMLIDKDKFAALSRKIVFALFSKTNATFILSLARRSNKTFGDFLSGKIIDSAIIGILTFIVLSIFKMPYTLLVSVIIGITNIIPFFGPFIGAIPSFFIILFVSPTKALWFLIIILIIQQLDGNIIGPKILGDSIGISAFWILFSLLFASKLLGLVGMIIGVPLFAIIYSIIKDIIESNLEKKGLPKDTSDYTN